MTTRSRSARPAATSVTDGGRTWTRFDTGSFDSVECTNALVCWASGEQGRVGRLTLPVG